MNDSGKPAWLDNSHPNYKRWERSRKLSEARGQFVLSVIEITTECNNLRILDLGSGEGGTSAVLSKNNFVVSADISVDRLKRQQSKNNNYELLLCDALFTPFKNKSFDLIIIQDVIEHVASPEDLIENIFKLIKPGGIIYLSTPNKLSMFNLIADPHWGLPVVSILKRDKIRKYFLKYFRKNEMNRKDIAQLLSLKELQKLFYGKFSYELNTKHSLQRLFRGDKGIVWSDLHLFLIKTLKMFYLDKLLILLSNNKPGIINKFFNPTFYFILKKNN